jgi:hypothetical protein
VRRELAQVLEENELLASQLGEWELAEESCRQATRIWTALDGEPPVGLDLTSDSP